MPMLDIQRRHAEVFRIRLGEKDAKGFPVKLTDAIRITSPNRSVVQAFVDVFGGVVEPWEGQFEAKLPTTELPIMVLPGQSVSQWWEKYRKSVCERRCDGVTESLTGKACVCPVDLTERMQSKDGCRPMTRVNVVCPDVAVVGAGSLVTHGMVAAETLPQSIQVAEAALARGLMVPAVLRVIEHKGKTHYIVPQIEIVGLSLNQLTTGEVSAPGLGGGEQRSLGSASPAAPPAPKGLPVVARTRAPEMAKVEDTKPLPETKRQRPPLPSEAAPKKNPYAQALHVFAAEVAKATELDAALLADLAVSVATGGRSTSANDLTRHTKDVAVLCLAEIRDGKAHPALTLGPDGGESYVLPTSDSHPTLDGDAA